MLRNHSKSTTTASAGLPNTRRFPNDAARRAFTLIELMVVIVIIGILIGLLVPAVMAAFRNARLTVVRTDITGLDNAIGNFNGVYHVNPPSRITLYEEADDWATDNRSKSLVLKIWPQFDFSINRNLNGDGDLTDAITLNGAECLVFFLGGMVDRSSGTVPSNWILKGFSKNPRNPFNVDGDSREGPFNEFQNGRLVDVNGNGMPEYVDPLPSQQTPYLYASSYDGRGYEETTDTTSPAAAMSIYGDVNIDPHRVYYQSYNPTGDAGATWKDKSYQIVSPGYDGLYGMQNNPGGNPARPFFLFNVDEKSNLGDADKDNLTNFHNTQLGD